ncbi:MAG: dihydroxyacetone kinase subunit L [Lachnospiraceae bacterium]|nr:dihydroxyacetone kinase subunit L [Lachnospiraceae bacterium]
MTAKELRSAWKTISCKIAENEAYLIGLDQQNGDGDLGLSLKNGFAAIVRYLDETDEEDLGRLFMGSAKTLNEASPSTLGTILSLGLSGMAKNLRGKSSADTGEIAEAMKQGLENIEKKAGSKEGEKTILDALYPALRALEEHRTASPETAWQAAADAAASGSERTRSLRAVHGRAAYYGEKSIGILDGGSAAGRLIFEALAERTP